MARPISAGWSTQQPFEAARLAVVGARLSLQCDDPVPGTGGLEIQRRRGTQRLQWSEIDKAVWTGAGGVAGLAVDSWVLTLHGQANGKRTTVVLSGPMVERQKEARALLAARFPPAR